MSFILSKLLFFLIKPLLWILALLLLAIFNHHKKWAKKAYILVLYMLIFFTNNVIISSIYHAYETHYPAKKSYDVGILLGGYSKSGLKQHLQASERGDRLTQTVYLYKTKQIKYILLSGGSGKLIGEETNEANLTQKYLRSIGVPDSAILMENKSRNTIENAKYSKEKIQSIMPNADILVISSAWHLPRSKMIFDRTFNHSLSYYPTDFIGKDNFDISDFIIPDAGALAYWEMIIKEWIGLMVDRYRIS